MHLSEFANPFEASQITFVGVARSRGNWDAAWPSTLRLAYKAGDRAILSLAFAQTTCRCAAAMCFPSTPSRCMTTVAYGASSPSTSYPYVAVGLGAAFVFLGLFEAYRRPGL